MTISIFYSWQSDHRQTRNFVRSALDAALAELRQDATLEEAQRDLVADQDTQGVPGSPGIADTILAKIRSADIFLADLSFIGPGPSDAPGVRRTPNPNVMMEYGYALHALGDSKIIAVFDESHGSPKDLPFDLAHRRWPIRFTLGPDKKKQKELLKEELKRAIRGIVSQFAQQVAPAISTAPFATAEPGDGVGRLRQPQDFLCLQHNNDKAVWLRNGPYSFLRLIPTTATTELGEVAAYKIAQAHLKPMGSMRGAGWTSGRHTSGSVVYWTAHDSPLQAWDASELFLTRELWANDSYHIIDTSREPAKTNGFSYIPSGAFEEVLIDTFINFVEVARDRLELKPPVRIAAGLVGVQGVKLAVDQQYFRNNFEGSILRTALVWDARLDAWTEDPFDFLLPYFAKIYDAAGLVRPPVRTVGVRQR